MNPLKKTAVGVALFGATMAGGALGASAIMSTASAQDTTTTTTAPAQSTPSAPDGTHDPAKGGHQANGITEEVLTGDAAAKATAAATAAVPGGTIERVETDAEGDAYEAHVVTADGQHVTVKMDENFNVTSTEDGMH
jgi:hypothetical protein